MKNSISFGLKKVEKSAALAIITVIVMLLFSVPPTAWTKQAKQRAARPQWPHPFPCRVHEGANKDLIVMTLGNVKTPLADGVFYPTRDEVVLNNGRVIRNYYRDSLGVRYFTPIDKSAFPLPPSGWCSWYYYYHHIDANEIKLNADWISKNLKDYGAEYVQIDDGWEGRTGNPRDHRDWTKVSPKFHGNMARLASYIRSLGLKPGIWLAPQGQSNPDVVNANPGAFLLNADTSVSHSWAGAYLVDPSSSAGRSYLRRLFSRLKGWGYNYFKIDGQPVVLAQYNLKKKYMKHPSDNVDSLYRSTLFAIRKAIGPKSYLLGCWGIPIDGVGIMNGARTRGDIVQSWGGFMTALGATLAYYYLNNVAWYCDPDALVLRYPLTTDQARAWATLQGLSGEALMSSDRLPDLSPERVAMLKSVFPAQNIRPLDLFPSKRLKHIWDLKINHLGKNYDVVGLFDFDRNESREMLLNWKDLGYKDTSLIHVFDFWNKEYLGAWRNGIALKISPTSCRVLTLLKSNGRIQLISTNRHITQGYPDLVQLTSNKEGTVFHGESKVIAGAPYKLYFVFPRGRNFKVKDAYAGGRKMKADNHQEWASVEFVPNRTSTIEWSVTFRAAGYLHFTEDLPRGINVSSNGLDGAEVHWSEQHCPNEGCRVYLDGRPLGYTPGNSFPLGGLNPDSTYTVSVRSVWQDGTESQKELKESFRLADMIPGRVLLSDVRPEREYAEWGYVTPNSSEPGEEIAIDGVGYRKGIATVANSEITYRIHGFYSRFTAVVGLDERNGGDPKVQFQLFGDGKELWHSSVMTRKSPAEHANVAISGVRELTLKAVRIGEASAHGGADWAEASIER